MEKAVCTIGLITLQDKKITSNNHQFLCVRRLINFLVLFLLRHLNWIERYSTMKIGRFFFEYIKFTSFEHMIRNAMLISLTFSFIKQ